MRRTTRMGVFVALEGVPRFVPRVGGAVRAATGCARLRGRRVPGRGACGGGGVPTRGRCPLRQARLNAEGVHPAASPAPGAPEAARPAPATPGTEQHRFGAEGDWAGGGGVTVWPVALGGLAPACDSVWPVRFGRKLQSVCGQGRRLVEQALIPQSSRGTGGRRGWGSGWRAFWQASRRGRDGEGACGAQVRMFERPQAASWRTGPVPPVPRGNPPAKQAGAASRPATPIPTRAAQAQAPHSNSTPVLR